MIIKHIAVCMMSFARSVYFTLQVLFVCACTNTPAKANALDRQYAPVRMDESPGDAVYF